ncbi:MAG: hypothetical protein WKG06_27945 [Segetibacter sp.]
MNTNKKIFLPLICLIVLIVSCTKQPYYEIPTDANGHVVITGVSSATSDGITTLDDKFTVNVTFPNAKEGDVMVAELLKLQAPSQGGAAQLLPLAGTQKEIKVGSDLKTSVSYTRVEAMMNVPGDFVTVTFAGKTDANLLRVSMINATKISGPKFGDKGVEMMRTADTAFFDIMVQPKLGAYTGSVIVKRKNGANDPWVNVGTGSFSTMSKVPVSGNDFAVGKDTMYYSFVAQQGALVDSSIMTVIVNDPSFFLKKSGTLSLANSSQAGMDILTNSSVTADNINAVISVGDGSLMFKGGAGWVAAGKSISFVPSTIDMYNNNNSNDAINAYENGVPTSTADPNQGEGVFIYKIINGPLPSDILYGIIKVLKIVPGVSVDYEYRIGNSYQHLSIIK